LNLVQFSKQFLQKNLKHHQPKRVIQDSSKKLTKSLPNLPRTIFHPLTHKSQPNLAKSHPHNPKVGDCFSFIFMWRYLYFSSFFWRIT